MAAKASLIPVQAEGWAAGLANLLSRELASWWKTRRWLTSTLLWLVIINGLLLIVMTSSEGEPTPTGGSLLEQATSLFCIFSGFFCPIAVMVSTQGTIVGEKQNGTAAWILSKPVSRIAFLLSKFLSDTLGFLVTMILLQGLAGYILMSAFGLTLQPLTFLPAIGLLYVNLLFFQSFTLMMGTFVNSRRTVIGVSLMMLFVFNQLAQLSFGKYLPGHLPYDAAALMAGKPFAGAFSLAVTAVPVVIFLGLAFWRFNREEF